ncbi:hypothetical protein FNW52_03760 [Flavobacterium sp. ZT3R18]|uniref:hypothetical protein n=1 Tax=Flavobacterium sp. ZT3R18 TaxID=2594429 RepID=UPI00117A1C39|nr:hypothetical protein [Flavobacterium sp. ZT3R18]TRX38028.1 hypothetical protein FNW52_03760 [Flavobacterium sp. ZT3R18]
MFFPILSIPLFVLVWYGIDNLIKRIFKSKYDKKYSVITFALAVPILFLLFVLILLALAFASGAEFP